MDTLTKPLPETKRQKFERIVTARLRKLHDDFDKLAQIGRNQHDYDYSEADVQRISAYLDEEVGRVLDMLKLRKRQTDFDFRFDEPQ